MNENEKDREKPNSPDSGSEDEDIILLLDELSPGQDDEPIIELTDSLNGIIPEPEEEVLDLTEPVVEAATPIEADADEVLDLIETALPDIEPSDRTAPLLLKTQPLGEEQSDDEIALNLSTIFEESDQHPIGDSADIEDASEETVSESGLQSLKPEESAGDDPDEPAISLSALFDEFSLEPEEEPKETLEPIQTTPSAARPVPETGLPPFAPEDTQIDEPRTEPVIPVSAPFDEVALTGKPPERTAPALASVPDTGEVDAPGNVVLTFEPKPDALFVESSVLADPLVDSMGINLGEDSAMTVPDKGSEFIPLPPSEKESIPVLTKDQLEAAIERVVRSLYGEKIERLLIDAVEKTVTEEIARLKAAILGKTDEERPD